MIRNLFNFTLAKPHYIINKIPKTFSSSLVEGKKRETIQAWINDFKTFKPIGIALVDKSIFGAPIRTDIMHRVVVHQLSKKRGIVQQHQKHRWEVAGSNRKIQQQKGAGRSRKGDRRSPVFRGGGRAFPRLTRDFTKKINKKEEMFGIRSALSSK
jgi:large subunit ribosomal protein L4